MRTQTQNARPNNCRFNSLADHDTFLLPKNELLSDIERKRSWGNKMEELEAIHQEIAPQVKAMRTALDEMDIDELSVELEHACRY